MAHRKKKKWNATEKISMAHRRKKKKKSGTLQRRLARPMAKG